MDQRQYSVGKLWHIGSQLGCNQLMYSLYNPARLLY